MEQTSHEEEWGWEHIAEDSEEKNVEVAANQGPSQIQVHDGSAPTQNTVNQGAAPNFIDDTQGITSSPSFQELEQAIGESLKWNSTGNSSQNLYGYNSNGQLSNGSPSSYGSHNGGIKRSGSKGKLHQGFKRVGSNNNNRVSPTSVRNNVNQMYQQFRNMNMSIGQVHQMNQIHQMHQQMQMNQIHMANANIMGMDKMYMGGNGGSVMMFPTTLSPVGSMNHLNLAGDASANGTSQVGQNGDSANNTKHENGSSSNVQPTTAVDARTELAPHINEAESRALILFHSPNIPQLEVRQACQKFGVLYYIRPDFHSKGVTLLSYFDLRVAVQAQSSLSEDLGGGKETSCHFSVMLHAINSNTEESRLIIKNLPSSNDENMEAKVDNICARYGPLRSIQRTFDTIPSKDASGSTSFEESGTSTVTVEFFNIQDARLAASELSASSASLWAAGVTVEFAPLENSKQSLCRQLLASLSRWRTEFAQTQQQSNLAIGNMVAQQGMNNLMQSRYMGNGINIPQGMGFANGMHQNMNADGTINGMYTQNANMNMAANMHRQHGQQSNGGNYSNNLGFLNYHQLNDRNRSNGTNSNGNGYHYHNNGNRSNGNGNNNGYDGHGDSNGNGQYYDNNNSHRGVANGNSRGNHYNQPGHSDNGQGQHGNSGKYMKPLHHYPNSMQPRRSRNNEDDGEYALDINRISQKEDVRTTVMVRNIPNKYNQQMLLHEVNINHEGTYDFFYLPIDFKNRCNVGYAFINFVKPEYIINFVQEFQGHRWKNFNSGKICEITYARIQGQSAMVARFQNSSLLDRDDEYKPLLFYSGKREPFPEPVRQQAIHDGSGNASSNGITGKGYGIDNGHHHDGPRSRRNSSSLSDGPALSA